MQAEMFDTPPPTPTPQGGGVLTCFGAKADNLARERGGWPEDAVVYLIEGINETQAMLTGEVPVGERKNQPGHPRFAARKDNPKIYRVVIQIAEWHALFAKQNGE